MCISIYIYGYIQQGERKVMNIDNISSVAGTLGGSFFASFLVGYFIKKVIKILMFVFGGILALLIYLQSQGMISVDVDINVDKIQSSAETVINTIAANTTDIFPTDNNNPSTIGNNLGIPLTGSAMAGFMLGITRRG